ncbi:MAG: DUF937 domain-containing protein [Lachnospiraceae bacterium]|nr:DUF937 domain-containing protein [Lachnospiraceae bacterium]
MDFSSILNTITSSDSIQQLSSLSGTSENDVSSILSSVLPQLLNGAQGQATNQETAQSFANALTSHGQQDTNDLSAFFGGIDLDDGQKIVNHLLGSDNAVATAETLSSESGVATSSITNIISAAAPLLMSLLGKQATSDKEAKEKDADGGIDLAGIVGSLFGGGDGDGKEGGGLGSLLSGLFK